MIGIGYGWIGPTLQKLQSDDSIFSNVTDDETSWLASIGEIGKLSGPFVSPVVVDNVGRKHTLFLMAIMYLIANGTILFARDIYILYASRFVFGVANGITDVVNSIYIAENCAPSFRGVVVSCLILTFFTSLFAEYVIAKYLSYLHAAIVNTTISVCVFISLCFGVETPYYLLMKGDYKRAKQNLQWLREGVEPSEVAKELEKIESSVSEETSRMQEKFTARFNTTANRKAIRIVVALCVLGSATGGGAFLMYGSSIFSPSTLLDADHYAMLYIAVMFFTVVVSPFIIEKFDRRTLIMLSYTGLACSNISSYVLIFLHSNGYVVAAYPWLLFASLAMYALCVPIAGAAGYAVKGEILPLSVRAIGMSMGVISQSITTFFVVKVFPSVRRNYGMETNFLMYSAAGLVAVVFVYYALPETRGKSLYEIQNALKKKPASKSADGANEEMLVA
jgi:MFS family permease